jgi:Cu/Ag efflux protein CusF
MKTKVSIALAGLLLAISTALFAGGKPEEGKIVKLDQDEKMMVVQGEKGDQWELYWTETTKLEGNLTLTELKEGDTVKFHFVEKDGKKWMTDLRRIKRAG